MKLIYCSSIILPSGLSNRWQSLNMAKAFKRKLGSDFYFGLSTIGQGSESYLEVIKEIDQSRILIFGKGKSYFLALRYLNFIKKNKIDYVYCREPRLLFFIIFWSKISFVKARFIYEAHAIFENTLIDRVIDWLVARLADYFLFITKHLRDLYIKKYGGSTKKTMVSPDGVDLEVFDLPLSQKQAREKLGLPLGKKIIGYFGRFKTLDKEKGIKDILEALRWLSDDILFLAMGGKAHHIGYYSEMAESLAVRDRVLFVGPHPQKDVAFYQKACDVLLMCYPYSKHYAFYMSPTKMFEYMVSKRPIIASDLPSLREILSEQSAFFVEPDNPEDLAKTINKVLANQLLSEKVAQQAFEDVQKYTWEKRIEGIIRFTCG